MPPTNMDTSAWTLQVTESGPNSPGSPAGRSYRSSGKRSELNKAATPLRSGARTALRPHTPGGWRRILMDVTDHSLPRVATRGSHDEHRMVGGAMPAGTAASAGRVAHGRRAAAVLCR